MRAMMLLLLMGMLAGCGPNIKNIGKESDPTRFYSLVPLATAPEDTVRRYPELMVAIRPISIAKYIDRSHIVIRESETRLNLSEFDRWAATPDKEVERVVAMNLTTLLGTEQVLTHPWEARLAPQLEVKITLNRFEYGLDGKAYLDASWQVFGEGGRVLAVRNLSLAREAQGNYEAIAQALSALVFELSEQIAATLRHAANTAPTRLTR